MVTLKFFAISILFLLSPERIKAQPIGNIHLGRKEPSSTTSSRLKDFNTGWRWIDRDWGAAFVPGIYKSYSSIFIDTDKKREAILWDEDEIGLYKDLVIKSVRPGFLLAEVTGYPVASFSAWMEEKNNDAYHKFDIGDGFNLLKNLSGGKQEPLSVSLFVGQLATFWDLDENDDLMIAAKGASGVVVTGGLHQLFDNSFVRSNWFRVEWKVKGSGGYANKTWNWDLKAGFRQYGLSDIPNTITIVLKRTRKEKSKTDWRVLHNSKVSIEFEYPVSESADGFSRIQAVYGKYFPFIGHLAGIDFGFLFENRREYSYESKSFSLDKVRQSEIFIKPVIFF